MQLPYEIWKMIVACLPVAEAKKLYSVNSALFDIAMDLRYQEARLWIGSPKARMHKDLNVFRHPHLSSRPKTLHVDMSSIAKSISRRNAEGWQPWRRMIPLIADLVTRGGSYQLGSIVAFAQNALSRLTSVTKLNVTYDYSGAYGRDPLILQLITDLWRVFADRVRFLQVRVAFENIHLLLPTSLHLPCLETLTVKAEGLIAPFDSMISTMIQSHNSTLRDVSFSTKSIAVDFLPICRALRDVPRLKAIHLSLPFGPFVPYPFPAYDMLDSCRHQLEFLSLNFGTYMREHTLRSLSFFREDWCFVDLPRLKELRIDPPIMRFGQEFIDYIHRFAPSLISLWIKPNLRLRYQEAELLSSIFHDFLSLRTLSICIRCFCPEVLALLARTLPRLHTLNLCYSYISPTTSERRLNYPDLPHLVRHLLPSRLHQLTPEQFYRAMQHHTRLFLEWKLESLDYIPFSIHSQSAEIERALTDHLPNVVWFCGVERDIYLSQAQRRPPAPLASPSQVITFTMF